MASQVIASPSLRSCEEIFREPKSDMHDHTGLDGHLEPNRNSEPPSPKDLIRCAGPNGNILGWDDLPISDIQHNIKPLDLENDILKGLCSDPKNLPSVLLWDDAGIQLFNEITKSPNYYPNDAEAEILASHVDDIVKKIASGSVVIELGSGNLKKTATFLKALARQKKIVHYYALDLCKDEIRDSLYNLTRAIGRSPYIRLHGLVCSYDGVPRWIQQTPSVASKPIFYLWFGNSIANHPPEAATSLLRTLKDIPNHNSRKANPKPSFIIAVDNCRDAATIEGAYNIPSGQNRRFVLNGLRRVNALAGREVFRSEDWVFKGQYDEAGRRYRSFYVAQRDMVLRVFGREIEVREQECVHAIDSWKWDESKIRAICERAGLKVGKSWRRKVEPQYGMYLLESGEEEP